jgi:hypothetical protein
VLGKAEGDGPAYVRRYEERRKVAIKPSSLSAFKALVCAEIFLLE